MLKPTIEAHQGEVGIAVKHLKTGESYEYKADRPMPTASLIKLPVMIATYEAVDKGKLSLTEMIELKKDDQVPGSGILTSHFSPGTKISLRDAIHLMIVYSDNTATNLVLDKLGLPPTNECMERLGCPDTKINSKVFRRDTSIAKDRSKKYGLGSTTARDMVKLCELLYDKKLVNEKACKQMLDHMYACDDKLKVPRLLPPGTKVAHKTGSVNASRTDAGIIDTPSGPIAYCILTDKNKDQRWTDDNEGDLFCAEIGAAIYQVLQSEGQDAGRDRSRRTLESGASGDLVEALQRTLNARIKPSPGIGTDGDFGPETEERGQEVSEAGEAGGRRHRERGDLEGARAAGDGRGAGAGAGGRERGEEPEVAAGFARWAAVCYVQGLGDHRRHDRRVSGRRSSGREARAGQHDQDDDRVSGDAPGREGSRRFSTKSSRFPSEADKTSGSSSEVKAGEKLPVGELLYGMMLPSGNDATVAFAEHFGDRLADEKDKEAKLDAATTASSRP